jgi:hypothetical protein
LRAAFLRAPNRRYSVYWAARGELGNGADELVKHRKAHIVPITDANTFFSTLHQRIETLAQSQRENPLSIELFVNSAKRLLAKPEYRIQLDELIMQEAERVVAQLSSAEFSPTAEWDQAAFRSRVKRYEAIAEPIASMAGVLGRWGDGNELPLVLDLLRTLYAHGERSSAGVVAYLSIRSYPAVLVFTAYGLGLARAERWKTLHRLFNAVIDREHRDPARLVEALFLWTWKGTDNNAWKNIEGLEKRKTPLSDHLLVTFLGWGKHFTGLAPNFELLFDRFEILGSLAYLEGEEKSEVASTLSVESRESIVWMPIGRTGWNSGNAEKLLDELARDPTRTELIDSGFARKDGEFLDLFIHNFRRFSSRMRW